MTDRPLGAPVPDWTPPPHPRGAQMTGRFAWLRPLQPADDAAALFAGFAGAPWVWDYLGEPPPADAAALQAVLEVWSGIASCEIFAIGPAGSAVPQGYACLMNVTPASGDIEIGNVNLSPVMQRSPLATEAFSLMLGWAFGHGYRRVVWKCNALNAPSRRAAQRLGFSYEGTFRKHLIVKGRNRDTAWFAMTDDDWRGVDGAGIGAAHAVWLAAGNFDGAGRQRQSLATLTAPHLFARDPSLEP